MSNPVNEEDKHRRSSDSTSPQPECCAITSPHCQHIKSPSRYPIYNCHSHGGRPDACHAAVHVFSSRRCLRNRYPGPSIDADPARHKGQLAIRNGRRRQRHRERATQIEKAAALNAIHHAGRTLRTCRSRRTRCSCSPRSARSARCSRGSGRTRGSRRSFRSRACRKQQQRRGGEQYMATRIETRIVTRIATRIATWGQGRTHGHSHLVTPRKRGV